MTPKCSFFPVVGQTLSSFVLSTRARFIFPAILTILIIGISTTFLIYFSSQKIVDNMIRKLLDEMSNNITITINNFVSAPTKSLLHLRSSTSLNEIQIEDSKKLSKTLHHYLSLETDFDYLYFANEKGGIITAGRLADGSRVLMMTENFKAGKFNQYAATMTGEPGQLKKAGAYFDPRTRSWYKNSRTSGAVWTRPYVGNQEKILGISLAIPFYTDNGDFKGVFGLDLILTSLTNYMRELVIGKTGVAFIMEDTGELIATSGEKGSVALNEKGEEERILAKSSPNPVIAAVAQNIFSKFPNLKQVDQRQIIIVDYNDDSFFTEIKPFQTATGIKWYICTVIPKSDYFYIIRQAMAVVIGITTILVILLTFSTFRMIGFVMKPIIQLRDSALAIEQGNWSYHKIKPYPDEIGQLSHAFYKMSQKLQHTFTEISDLNRNLEKKVKERTREIEEKNQIITQTSEERNELIHILCHDLKNPIGNIESFMDILKENPGDFENLSPYIIQSAKHSRQIIDEIRKLNALEDHKIVLELIPCNLSELVTKTLDVFHLQLIHKNISTDIQVPDDINIYADSVSFVNSVLCNLVSNAIKFSYDNSSISIIANREEEQVTLTIKDSGIGIPDFLIDDLFKFTKQTSRVGTAGEMGTGYGMPLVKKVIELHKGSIEVESVEENEQNPASGTKVKLILKQA